MTLTADDYSTDPDTAPGGLLRDEVPPAGGADAAEVPARRQIGTRLLCYLEGADEPLEVLVTNRERIHYERTAQKRGWPAATDAKNLAMTFLCWSAATRAGLTALKYEQWEQALLDYDAAEVPTDPTR